MATKKKLSVSDEEIKEPKAAVAETPKKPTRKKTVKAEPAEIKPEAAAVETEPVKAEPAKKPARKTAKKAETEPKTEPAKKPARRSAKKAKTAPKAEPVPAKAVEAAAESAAVAAYPAVEPARTLPETEPAPVEAVPTEPAPAVTAPAETAPVEPAPVEAAPEAPVEAAPVEAAPEAPAAPVEAAPEAPELPQPRRSVAFIGSECYPFVKTGGLGDVMYALPRALVSQNCDVKVILPRYHCIPQKWQEKMVYRGSFMMDLCADGRSFYVGIMEYVADGVVYDFIDNQEFFTSGSPYLNLVDDIPKFCYFAKAALAALNYLDWIPDIIHCHDWQAALVPIYLRTLFADTKLAGAKSILTIHNLRFQGVYNIPTLRYWTGLPDYVFHADVMTQNWVDANMMKGGLTYADRITTVSGTYAGEIQTAFYGEGLDNHLRYHSGKLRGIVNGIDTEQWDPAADGRLAENYDRKTALAGKKANKLAMQKALGLDEDADKMVIGLISRLTDQKGLDLVNAILPQLIDGNTQVVVLGTGEACYEESFRHYEQVYHGSVCSNIMYDEGRAHNIYAGADAFLVPSLFEPCGLTQLIAMHYGTVPIVRETGGLKDTVAPYNCYTNEGNGFTFDRYEAWLLLDAVNRAKTLYFTDRDRWNEMVLRDMDKDVSWDVSARQYRQLYLELKP